MRKKILKLLPFALMFLLFSCKQNAINKIFIEGEIIGNPSQTVFLYEILPDEATLIDSASIINGKFKFSIKQTQTSFYEINFGTSQKVSIIAKGGDYLLFKGDLSKGAESFMITGSDENNWYREMNLRIQKCYNVTDSLSKILKESLYNDDYETIKNNIDTAYYNVFNEQKVWLKNFILKHPNSLVSLEAFYQSLGNKRFFDNFLDFDLMELLHRNLNSSLKANIHVESFNQKFDKVKTKIESDKKIKASLIPGKPVPKMSFFTDDKGVISTTDFKGKMLLIYFWSFISKSSVEEFSKINAFSKKHKIEIMSISLNPNTEEALAFSRQKTPYATCVNEDKMFESQSAQIFDIQSVPYFYLIDNNGIIVYHSNRLDSISLHYKEISK